jgi:hypothetical protein
MRSIGLRDVAVCVYRAGIGDAEFQHGQAGRRETVRWFTWFLRPSPRTLRWLTREHQIVEPVRVISPTRVASSDISH